jgi:lysylphosphatidylglycerol synthetase-like protein (DUF2156 family)
MRVSLSPQDFKELVLSHHPDRPCFDRDVIILSGKRICAGCLFAYPTALALFFIIRPAGMSSIIIALLLAAVSQARRLTENRIIQNFFRLVAGIALGFGLGGGYWAVTSGQWFMVILLLCGAGLYALFKIQSMQRALEGETPG